MLLDTRPGRHTTETPTDREYQQQKRNPFHSNMGKKGKKAQAGKPKKLKPKDIGKRLDALVKKLEEELNGADLFAPLPPTEDCPICFVPLPRFLGEISYKICCGKSICRGCEEESIAVSKKENAQNDRECISCPFCRVPAPTSENIARIMEERILTNNSEALCIMGGYMLKGGNGFPKDELRAFDCLIRSIELGSAESCGKLAAWFREGTGAPKDMKRANLCMKIGALRGDIYCRHNIGVREYNAGNHEVGIRHFKLAAEAGYQVSLNGLRDVYNADGKMPGKEFISKKCLG